jgi:hypothetical protein
MRKAVLIVMASTLLYPLCMAEQPHVAGERIVYSVKMGLVPIGQAVFTQLPQQELRGRRVNVMTFETKVNGFYDLEKIFSDPVTMLPLRVERLVRFTGTEHIIEEYDQQKFSLMITKRKGDKTEKQVIHKKGPIHNAILLPFYVRDKKLTQGWHFVALLPTQEFTIHLKEMKRIATAAGSLECYSFTSEPRRFEIMISNDQRRIPVKMTGTSGLGYTLVMKEYRPG